MIRSAEEILRQGIGLIPFVTMNHNQGKAIIEAIKVAQREAIEECADKVRVINTTKDIYEQLCVINKQSILNLLNEVK